jgi:DNA primase
LKDKLLEIHEQITRRWQTALANEAAGQPARDYLAKRGVSAEAVTLFRLGAAPEAWDDTVNWARSKGYDPGLVEQAGLILRKEGTDHFYDRFRGRLMFPICDDQGRVVGFSGRILAGDEKTAKYVNSPETPIFTKSKLFFGLDKSKRALLEADSAIVCEGQLDLIACFMAGIQNIVAPQGTAFTADHARILKRFVNEVVLCFDSDAAGQNAAVRSLDHLLASGLAIRVATVPEPHDPDSFIKVSGGPAFKELIERAQGFFDYYLNRLCATNEVTTDKGRLAVLEAMSEAVHKTGNSVLVDKYAQKTALRLGVAPDAVRADFKRLAHSQPAAAPEETDESFEDATPAQPPGPQEYWLIKLLLANDELVPWAAAHLRPEWVQHPLARSIVEQRIEAHTRQIWTSLGAFVAELATPEMRNLVTEAVTEARPIPNPAQQLSDVALRLRNQTLDREIASLMLQANQPEATDEQRLGLIRRQGQIRAAKRLPIAPGP